METFCLIAVKGSLHKPIKEGSVELIQLEKARVKHNYKGWKLQVRRKENYLKHPILVKKIKNKFA